MAAPYNPPVKGQDFVLRVSLSDMATAGSFKSNPSIAAGDFKLDKDGAGLVDLATLPVVEPAGSVLVKIVLSSAEMNADVVTIVGIDQTATKEWADFVLSIPTVLPGELPTPLSTTAIVMPSDTANITLGTPEASGGETAIAYEDGYVSVTNLPYGAGMNLYGAGASYGSTDGAGLYFSWFSPSFAGFYVGKWGTAPEPSLLVQNWNLGSDSAPHLLPYTNNVQDIGSTAKWVRGLYSALLRFMTRAAPGTPADGDMWFTGTLLQMRVGGVTKTITMT